MSWRFELIGNSREPLIQQLESKADNGEMPRSLALQIINDIEQLKIPPTAREDNYAIKVFSCGHISGKARAWEAHVTVLDITY